MTAETPLDASDDTQRRVLWVVLMLNLLLTVGFGIAGVIGDSNALLANALDNASDSFVYIVSLFALTRSPVWKRGAARVSAILLLLFAVGVLADAVRRYFGGSEPVGMALVAMAVVGAAVNAYCYWLFHRIRKANVSVRAAETFSFNDSVSNAGMALAGGLIIWTGFAWPDLVVGVAIAAISVKGGVDILRDAHLDAKGRRHHGS